MELFFSDDIRDGRVRLDPEESAHCVRVLRHRAGDEISVIDGRGTLYRCTLELADAKGAEAVVVEAQPGFGAHSYHLTMAVCPTKNIDRYEWFVEKATEIGVDVVVPVVGERSERRVVKTDRLRRLALSAAKQSLKGAVPQVAEPLSVRDFIAAAPADALKLICYCFDDVPRCSIRNVLNLRAGAAPNETIADKDFEDGGSSLRGGGTPIETVATHGFVSGRGPTARLGGMSEAKFRGGSPRPQVMILIGPEGDFSPEEAAFARERGWVPVALGESRLRTETAAVVAATAVYLSLSA